MFRPLLLLLLFLSGYAGSAAAIRFSSAAEKEEAVKRADSRVRMACAAQWGGVEPASGHAAAADTLRAALYEDTVALPMWLQVRGRLTLESYRLGAAPAAADYAEMARAISSCRKAEAFHDAFFLNCAMAVADKAALDGESDKAQLYYLYARKASVKMFGDKPNLVDTRIFSQLAMLAADGGDNDTAATCYTMLLRLMPAEAEDYVALTASAACFFYDMRDFERMGAAYERCVAAFKAGSGTPSEFMQAAPVLNAPGMGSAEAERALAAVARRADTADIADLTALASMQAKAGHMAEAFATSRRVREMWPSVLPGLETIDVAVLTGQIATMLSHLGDIDGAIEFVRASIEPTERSFGDIDPSIARRMRAMEADYLQLAGRHRECLAQLEECMADPALSAAERFGLRRSGMAAYLATGNYERAVAMADELLPDAPDADELRQLLNDKAAALVSLIDVAYEADAAAREAASAELQRTVAALDTLRRTEFPDDAELRVMQLMFAATAAFLDDDNSAMLAAADSCAAVVERDIRNASLAEDYRASLAMYYVKARRYDRAAELLGEGEATAGEPDIVRIYRNQLRSEVALGRGESERARSLYAAHCADIAAMTGRHFASLTEAERSGYWRMFRRQIQDAGRFAGDAAGRPSDFGGAVYNLELFSKGLLLNSSLAFRRVVEQSGDAALTEKHERLAALERSLKMASERGGMGDREREARRSEAERLELEIMEGCKAYGDYTARLTADWRDVRAALAEGDAAVEFVQYSDLERRRFLGAAIVTSSLELPVFVPLGAEDDVADSVERDFDGSAVWGPLAQYFTSGGRVFFSAAGYLHRLPVESCAPQGLECAFYRLSSTRELLRTDVERQEAGASAEAAAFGDIDYGTAPAPTGSGRREADAYLAPLPGTRAELECLGRLWRGKLEPYAGKEASRGNFLGLRHSGLRLLHIGTHGYFADGGESPAGMMPVPALTATSTEDRALRNSGLYFAGANDAAATAAAGIDNFRVNAEEISALDMSGIDLAVLSACETAAGAISGEGVFGLQRGFKLAGARSLLMSLWKVDDAATAFLMGEFYRHLLGDAGAGIEPCGKHAALEAAKRAVRSCPQWADPEYWAAFILLDAKD